VPYEEQGDKEDNTCEEKYPESEFVGHAVITLQSNTTRGMSRLYVKSFASSVTERFNLSQRFRHGNIWGWGRSYD
jgi:hypothetical protein